MIQSWKSSHQAAKFQKFQLLLICMTSNRKCFWNPMYYLWGLLLYTELVEILTRQNCQKNLDIQGVFLDVLAAHLISVTGGQSCFQLFRSDVMMVCKNLRQRGLHLRMAKPFENLRI